MTTLRLVAGVGPPAGLALGLGPRDDGSDGPALLASYHYIKAWERERGRYCYRDWTLDSGAFSAFNSGAQIDLDEYIDYCKRGLSTDEKLTEVMALDVIGSWRGSRKNTEKMWAQGVPAIPVYHLEDPWDVLVGLAKDYPKIAIGGVVGSLQGRKAKVQFYEQVFARVWPKPMHGLGLSEEWLMMRFPFHSVDSSSWQLGPAAYGVWRVGGNYNGGEVGFRRLPVRSNKSQAHQLRPEVDWHLRMEQRVKTRWRKEMALLEAML